MNRLLYLLFSMCVAGSGAQAQSFVYRPNNPNFGGNTFNYSWLLSQAQAQDRNVDPTSQQRTSTATSRTTTSSLDNFAQSLQNQLLNRITNSLINQQFGEGTLQAGTYRFGDFQVEISNGSDGVVVRVVDGKGGETTITVPYY